jgi:hypothetical protein
MPYLDQIVCSLNDIIKTEALSEFNVNSFGISEVAIGTNNTKFPSTIDGSNEIKPIVIDDLFDILLYHKCDGVSNSTLKGYGRSSDNLIEVASMSIMLFAFRNKVKRSINWFESVIKEEIPRSFMDDGATQKTTVAFSNSSYDTLGLYTKEWVGIKLDYPDISGMELKYTITNKWFKGCLKKCEIL